MVERPIKKSERQKVAEPQDVLEEALETQLGSTEDDFPGETQSPRKGRTSQSFRGKGNSKRKGKGKQAEDERPGQVNPALMRGPRPTKPKPPVLKAEPEVVESSTTEEIGEQ